jgi:hypothetical protein
MFPHWIPSAHTRRPQATQQTATASHCSGPRLGPLVQSGAEQTNPSPQTARRQPVTHRSVSLWLPSSHCSPSWGSVMPSPQRDGRQLVRHAALGAFELRAPLSHSSPASRIPSPQRPTRQALTSNPLQSARHASVPRV